MSHLRKVEANQDDLTVHQNTLRRCLTPTTIKVGAVVLGLLLVGAGLTLYFLHVNAIAAYVIGGIGGAIIVGRAIWSIVGCLRGKNESIGVQEFTLNLSQVEGNPRITEEEVTALLRDNPNLKQLRIQLRPHRLDTNWDPDFKALDPHFKWSSLQSSGVFRIYERK